MHPWTVNFSSHYSIQDLVLITLSISHAISCTDTQVHSISFPESYLKGVVIAVISDINLPCRETELLCLASKFPSREGLSGGADVLLFSRKGSFPAWHILNQGVSALGSLVIKHFHNPQIYFLSSPGSFLFVCLFDCFLLLEQS